MVPQRIHRSDNLALVLKSLGKFCLALCAIGAFAWTAPAHDIPNDIAIQTFLKPEGRQLHYLVRIPLKAIREVDFPLRGPGYLDLDRIDGYLRDATIQWIAQFTEIAEGNTPLPKPEIVDARLSLESDKSFASYEEALAHLKAPRLPNNTDLYWEQAMLDVQLDYPIQSERSEFSIHPAYERLGLRVVTALRFITPPRSASAREAQAREGAAVIEARSRNDGAVRAFEFVGDPGLVRLDPRWY